MSRGKSPNFAKGVRVISRKDLAKRWKVSPSTIDTWGQLGKLKRVATGLYDLQHAEAFRANQDPAARERGMLERLQNGRLRSTPEDPGEADKRAEAAIEAAMTDADLDPFPADATEETVAAELQRYRVRKVQAEAGLANLKLREASGELIPYDRAFEISRDAGIVLRTRLLALPHRIGPQLASVSDPKEVEAVVRKEIEQIVEDYCAEMRRLIPDLLLDPMRPSSFS